MGGKVSSKSNYQDRYGGNHKSNNKNSSFYPKPNSNLLSFEKESQSLKDVLCAYVNDSGCLFTILPKELLCIIINLWGGMQFFFSSHLNLSQSFQIQRWLFGRKLYKIYSSSMFDEAPFSVQTLDTAVRGARGSCITLIKATCGSLFGAYSRKGLKEYGNNNDPTAFIFSLYCADGNLRVPMKFLNMTDTGFWASYTHIKQGEESYYAFSGDDDNLTYRSNGKQENIELYLPDGCNFQKNAWYKPNGKIYKTRKLAKGELTQDEKIFNSVGNVVQQKRMLHYFQAESIEVFAIRYVHETLNDALITSII